MADRPTEAEFDELKRKRDEGLAACVDALCAKYGWSRKEVTFHASGAGPCYCACPEGPCQHVWDGPEERGEDHQSATCSRCGASAMMHDMRCGE
jgi:hypothetical protein